jgi:hypothetical protein
MTAPNMISELIIGCLKTIPLVAIPRNAPIIVGTMVRANNR